MALDANLDQGQTADLRPMSTNGADWQIRDCECGFLNGPRFVLQEVVPNRLNSADEAIEFRRSNLCSGQGNPFPVRKIPNMLTFDIVGIFDARRSEFAFIRCRLKNKFRREMKYTPTKVNNCL